MIWYYLLVISLNSTKEHLTRTVTVRTNNCGMLSHYHPEVFPQHKQMLANCLLWARSKKITRSHRVISSCCPTCLKVIAIRWGKDYALTEGMPFCISNPVWILKHVGVRLFYLLSSPDNRLHYYLGKFLCPL